MIEKILDAMEAERSMHIRIEAKIRAYRHRLEIELGGMNAKRNAEHAENLRNQINECFECEKMAIKRQNSAREMMDEVHSHFAQEKFR